MFWDVDFDVAVKDGSASLSMLLLGYSLVLNEINGEFNSPSRTSFHFYSRAHDSDSRLSGLGGLAIHARARRSDPEIYGG